MNEQSNEGAISPAELDDILGPDDQELGALVEEMMDAAADESAAKKRKSEAKAKIISRMDEMGVTGVTVAGRKLGFSTTTYYGVHTEDPEKRKRFQEWMATLAPDINIPATDKVKKAVELWLDEHPSEDLPDFIKVTENRTLTNRKA